MSLSQGARSAEFEKSIRLIRSSIKILRIYRVITLTIGVVVTFLLVGIALLSELPGAQLNMSFMFTLLGIVGMCLLIYGWNAWQIKRKQTELEILRRLFEEE